MKLKQQDKGLWQKNRDWFRDLAEDIRALVEAYKDHRPDSAEGRMVAQMRDVLPVLEQFYADALADASESYKSAPRAEKNTTREGGVKYQARRLTEEDLSAYLRAGSRANKSKVSALKAGQQIILTSAHQIKQFINNAIDRKLSNNTTVAYGKVNDRLADDVLAASDGNIKIKDNYLELIPDNLQHAYEQHHSAKQVGDIDLDRSDFENIPEYLDSYTEVVYAIEYTSGKVAVCVSKRLPNGRILLIETVSKSRGALQFKNAIGVSESKYQSDYVSVYKKRAGTNTRGSNSSNNSLRDGSNPKDSIRNSEPEVKEKFSERDPEVERAYKRLEKENGKLRQDVEYLKEMLKLQKTGTQGKKFTRSSVEAAAGQLMEQADAQGTKKELAGLLNGKIIKKSSLEFVKTFF